MALSRINSQSIADGTVIASDIADGTVTNTKLAGSITSDKITSVSNTAISGLIQAAQIGSVSNTALSGLIQAAQIGSVSNTAISGVIEVSQLADTLNLASKTVTLPAGVGGKVLGISSITIDSTSATYSASPTQLGNLPIYYVSGGVRSATITKQSATSRILVFFAYTTQTTQFVNNHTIVVFKDSSNYVILGYDINRWANDIGSTVVATGVIPFSGLGTGSHTFNVVPCRSNNAGTQGVAINGRVQSDQSEPTSSYVYAMEVEA